MADHLIILSIDRLNAGAIGAYGNAAAQTRAFNRLAGEAWLSEFAFATGVELGGAFDSWWQGKHPLAATGRASLMSRWKEEGRKSWLITDDPAIAERPDAALFDQLLKVDALPAETAASVGETQFAQLIGAAIERLPALAPRSALWIHSQGLSGVWDAPADLRQQVRDEEDPPAATFVEPPALQLGSHFDPDELLPIAQAYAAQVLVIDECLELLLDALQEQQLSSDSLLVVTSPRGYLLGQQGIVGPSPALLEDQLHIPLFIRHPDGRRAAERDLGLRELRDVYTFLASLEGSPPSRDRISMHSANEQALRTWAWQYRSRAEQSELYAKPDDRSEVNDVALRCQDVVEKLAELSQATAGAIANNAEGSLPPLEDELADAWR